jgi:hypothetical protein
MTGGGVLARLSIDAVKYGQRSPIREVATLSARMYFYNRLPASPFWRRQFATRAAVAEHLGLQRGAPTAEALRKSWWSPPAPLTFEGWTRWQSRSEQRVHQESTPTYKLYVSPDMRFVREGFEATVHVLTRERAPSLKVGSDLYGLLRPDKIVAYFESLDHLQTTADRLRDELQGCPAHGVPFTAELTPDGLLSWGIDPPPGRPIPGWRERESWRLWVTNRLATALLAARTTGPAAVEPWQFALERLRADGVDPVTWIPTESAVA